MRGTSLLFALLLSGCADYAVTVQGVPLDRLAGAAAERTPAEAGESAAAPLNDAGVLREREGDLAGALRCYRLALEKDPAFVTAWVNAGNVQLKLGDLPEAERCYRTALELDPDNPRGLNNLAWLHLSRKERIQEAASLLERALAADPEHRWLYLDSLGWARHLEGKDEAAIEALAEAIALTPDGEDGLLAEAHYHLGLIRQERGENADAAEHLRAALERSPDAAREAEIRELLRQIPKGR